MLPDFIVTVLDWLCLIQLNNTMTLYYPMMNLYRWVISWCSWYFKYKDIAAVSLQKLTRAQTMKWFLCIPTCKIAVHTDHSTAMIEGRLKIIVSYHKIFTVFYRSEVPTHKFTQKPWRDMTQVLNINVHQLWISYSLFIWIGMQMLSTEIRHWHKFIQEWILWLLLAAHCIKCNMYL